MESNIKEIRSRFHIYDTCNWINTHKFTKVCLQFPDELLSISSCIYEELKKETDSDLYILGDTSYASCCIDVVASMHVQSDAIVHYGHTCFSKVNIPVFLVFNEKYLNLQNVFQLLQNNKTIDNLDKLCLFYNCEYDHAKAILAEHWFQHFPKSYMAFIDLTSYSTNNFFGRVIKNKDNEEFSSDILKDCVCIFIGTSGHTFFNFTVAVAAKKWYLLDPETMQINDIEQSSWFKRRRFLIEKCKDANVVGILICKIAGDQTKDIINRMKQLCKANGKKSYIVSVGKPNVAKLANFPEIDIYVMIACPENNLYDSRDFYQPIVYPYELEVAFNSNQEDYLTTHVTNYDELLSGGKHNKDIAEVTESTDVSLVTGKLRETKIVSTSACTDLVEKQNWEIDNIGFNLKSKSWRGLEQKLGETEVKQVEKGRDGLPLQYSNEPE
ncbi:unnamed protein product [Leptosia nina]|uniref:2-(3-amino-3-carboxypropyl)histidine synthase subunit 2 n=1 Tax=Leptosia nina TaxID=320188 RepID=A0AAV1J5J9_9NEOP